MTATRVPLGAVTDMMSGFAFKSQQFLEGTDDGVYLLRGENVQQGFIRWGDKAKKWRTDEYEEMARYQLEKDDVILAMDRPIVGGGLKLAWIKEQDLPSLLVQRVCRIRGVAGVARTNYLRYALSTPEFLAHIDRVTTGANIPHISGKDIAGYEVRIPSLDEQDLAIKFLGAFDGLIENNQRRIALLEESARLLYQEWFLKFRYPGCESNQRAGALPLGWQAGVAHDFLQVLSGGTPNTAVEHYWGGGIPFFTPKDCSGSLYVLDTEKTLTEDGVAACNSRLFGKETIFITARGTVGKVALAQRPMAMNQSCYALVPRYGLDNLFLFLAIEAGVSRLRGMASGGVFDAIVVDTFRYMPFICPPLELAKAFGQRVRPVFDQVECLLRQNNSLVRARNELLPRLLSGSITI
jgi:type I restriction enzyme S subunit